MTQLHLSKAIVVMVVACCVGGLAAPLRAATPAQVEKAIKDAVDYLYKKQDKEGTWEPDDPKVNRHHQEGGWTAIAVYALLAAGESPQDPKLKKAIDYLLKQEMKGVYAVGIRLNVWHLLPPRPEVRQAMHRDAQYLMNAMKAGSANPKDGSRGMWDYVLNKGRRYDHSVSQYGVLGLWAAAQSNYEIPDKIWEQIDAGWRKNQEEDGGWKYVATAHTDNVTDTTASMTAAGVASLFVTQDYLAQNAGVACQGNINNPNIEAGLRWIHARGEQIVKGANYYTLYGIERIGVASGHKYFGTVDWYDVGADRLVKGQKEGGWGTVSDTAFGILFLSRGRAPVIFNKLEYAQFTGGDRVKPASWNQRPRDAANFARWMGKQIERDLNWQIVNLKVDVSDLHDSQILLITGKEPLRFAPEEEAKLKQFVEQGGMILGNADCASKNFADSFKKLGTKLFGHEFRELPEGHPIYTNGQYPRPQLKNQPSLLGLSNGVRELMLLFPAADPPRGWQLDNFTAERKGLSEIATNIVLYSVDKQNLRYKGQTFIVTPVKDVKITRTIKLARLKYAGNWDPEPGGWRRLGAVLHNQFQTKVDVQSVDLGSGKLDKSFGVAHLTGTTKAALSDTQRDELKRFILAGGTLVIDSAGGGNAFAQSIEAEMKPVLADLKAALTLLPVAHPLYASGHRVTAVEYRTFARKTLGNIHTPRLRGADVGGRLGIVVSDEDLSAGLVGQPVDGVVGYVPTGNALPAAAKAPAERTAAGATELMSNVVLYASGVRPPAEVAAKPDAAKKPADPTKKPAEPAKKEPGKAEAAAKPVEKK